VLEKACIATKTAFVSRSVVQTEGRNSFKTLRESTKIEVGAMDPNALNAALAALAANQPQQQQQFQLQQQQMSWFAIVLV
jgi:hypothetical protein